MTTDNFLYALLCAFGLAAGQILFKTGAMQLRDTGGSGFLVSCMTNPYIITGIVLYTLVTFMWIWLLRDANLSSIFPVTALVYALVPPVSIVLWKEPYNSSLVVGMVLIVTGVFMIAHTRV